MHKLSRSLLCLIILLTAFHVSSKISEKQAEQNVKGFYEALKYTVTKGNINTDHDYKEKWMALTTEGARLPNEPHKMNFLWHEGFGGSAEFMQPSYYFDCYAKARPKIQDYLYTPISDIIAAKKPDLKNQSTFDVDYYHVKISKVIKVNGHVFEIKDDVFIKAENGHISYIKNQFGGEIPNVITSAETGADAIADADYQYTIGNYRTSYELYRKAVASSTLDQLDEADASYRIAILLYYHPKQCEPTTNRKEINRLISAFLTHAHETGNWYVREKVEKAKYYMEN